MKKNRLTGEVVVSFSSGFFALKCNIGWKSECAGLFHRKVDSSYPDYSAGKNCMLVKLFSSAIWCHNKAVE